MSFARSAYEPYGEFFRSCVQEYVQSYVIPNAVQKTISLQNVDIGHTDFIFRTDSVHTACGARNRTNSLP